MNFSLQTSEKWQEHERSWLAAYAAKNDGPMAVRQRAETNHAYRTAFQRDRDRILHSHAFRRLKHKRQVFLITYGDHFRTRLTHTLEVAQIARTMARTLRLNEDLVEAIALGHDLGHTPFGHLGEVVLDEVLQGRDTLDATLSPENHGGFKHNYQSLRVVDYLEEKYEFPGLNLTVATREGILKHTRLKRNRYRYPDADFSGLHFESEVATTLEGQVVALADEVAQRTHDLEDGMRAALVDVDEVRSLEIVKSVEEKMSLVKFLPAQNELYVLRLINGLIELLVTDIIEETFRRATRLLETGKSECFANIEVVAFSEDIDPLQKALNKFIYERIIFVPALQKSDASARELLRGLFRVYASDPSCHPQDFSRRIRHHDTETVAPRTIADFIAGMTDNFAIAEARRLYQHPLFPASLNLQLLLPPSIVRP